MSGEQNDPESGLPHAGHILCNMMFYEYHKNKNKSEVDLENGENDKKEV